MKIGIKFEMGYSSWLRYVAGVGALLVLLVGVGHGELLFSTISYDTMAVLRSPHSEGDGQTLINSAKLPIP